MKEAEWLGTRDALQLLPAVEHVVTSRKLRLFMVACCWSGWRHYGLPAVVNLLETAERNAEDQTARAGREPGRHRQNPVWFWGIPVEQLLCPQGQELSAVSAFLTALQSSSPPYFGDAARVAEWVSEQRATRAALFRDVVGNPYQRVELSPDWLTSTVIQIARGMYRSRDFSAMPILADALQEAGCDSEEVPDHCRDPKQVHFRGCWVVDLLLGKE